jgi:hypothetical protein
MTPLVESAAERFARLAEGHDAVLTEVPATIGIVDRLVVRFDHEAMASRTSVEIGPICPETGVRIPVAVLPPLWCCGGRTSVGRNASPPLALTGQLSFERAGRRRRESGCRLVPVHLAQLAGGGLDQRLFFAEDDDRGAASEDFHRRDFVAAAAPGRFRTAELVKVALAADRAERSYAGAPDLDLEGRGATTLARRRRAVAVDEGPADPPPALLECMPIGRRALHYGFERETGCFRAGVVEAVGIERLRVGQSQIVVRGASGGQPGEQGQSEEANDCTDLPGGNSAPSV